MGFDIPNIKPFTSTIDIFQDIVEAVRPKCNFIYGNAEYIVNELTQMSKSARTRSKAYPLIAVLTDFEEDKDDFVTTDIIFCVESDKSYTNQQRKEKSFIAQLQPLLDSFIKNVTKHTRVYGQYEYDHTRIDMYSIGRKPLFVGKTITTDYVDAIKLENFKIKINKK